MTVANSVDWTVFSLVIGMVAMKADEKEWRTDFSTTVPKGAKEVALTAGTTDVLKAGLKDLIAAAT